MRPSGPRRLLCDVLERLLWTFVQAGLASLAVGGLFGLEAWKGAAIAGAAAVLSLLKGLAAARLGALSASTLPSALDPAGAGTTEVRP